MISLHTAATHFFVRCSLNPYIYTNQFNKNIDFTENNCLVAIYLIDLRVIIT